MKRIAAITVLILAAMTAFAQGVRVDIPLWTSGPNVPVSGGPLPQSLLLANSTVNICVHPATGSSCTPVTTYTDVTLATACPTNSPVVQLPGTACVATTGPRGNLGFWYAGGVVDYFVHSSYGNFGPFTTSGGGTGIINSGQLALAQYPSATAASVSPSHFTYDALTGNNLTIPGTLGVAGTIQSNSIASSPTTSAVCPNGTGGALTTVGCAAGGGTISGQANGVIPLATASTTITAQSHLDDGVTTSNTITSSRNFAVPLGTIIAQTGFGVQYCAQWQTGGGNNGCANSAASNQHGYADPGYATTEPSSFNFNTISTSNNFWAPASFHWTNDQQGYITEFYHDWNPSGSNWGNGHNAVEDHAFLIDNIVPGSSTTTVHQNGIGMDIRSTTPGWNIGNIASGSQGWWSHNAFEISSTLFSSGVNTGINGTFTKFGAGDHTGGYIYVHGRGGATGASDEGTKAWPWQVIEDTTFRGTTCSSGCTTGSTSVKLAANLSYGTGMYVYDSTAGATYTGTISNIAGGLGSSAAATISATVPVSNAWGTLSGACNAPINPNPSQGFATSETCTVTLTSGTFVTGTTNLICFASQQHEWTYATAVGSASSTQTITVPLRHSHASGSLVMQGGACGYGMEMTAFTSTGQKYFFDVIGSTGANTILVGGWKAGVFQGGPISGIFSHLLYDVGQTTAVTNGGSGTTVTVTYTSSGSTLFAPWQYNKYNYLIQGTSDAAVNTTCTNVVWSSQTTFTCTIAGLTGSHTTATTGTFQLSTASAPINTFNLWPIAETIDVQNEATTPPVADGTDTFEPNIIAFNTGDTIVQPNQTAAIFRGETGVETINNPYALYNGIVLQTFGTGIVGGSSSAANGNSFYGVQSSASDSQYIGMGGFQTPPNLLAISGAFDNGIITDHGPAYGAGGMIWVTPTTAQKADANYVYDVFNLTHSSGGLTLADTPNTGAVTLLDTSSGAMTIQAVGALNLTGSSITGTGDFTDTGNVTLGGAGKTVALNGTVSFAGNLALGNHTLTGTTTPVNFDLGGTYGTNTAGTSGNCKVFVLNDAGTNKYCVGASASNMEFQLPTGATFNFYVNGVAKQTIGTVITSNVPPITGGTAFTVSGCGTAGSVTGNGAAGSFTVGTGTTNCTFTVTINGATGMTATHGWIANADDTTANIHCVNSTTVSATTVVFVCTGTIATNDLIKFSAVAY